MRLIGWIRLRLGLCRMGEYGCWRRPVGTWDLNGFLVPLCARHWVELHREIGEPLLGEWVPR